MPRPIACLLAILVGVAAMSFLPAAADGSVAPGARPQVAASPATPERIWVAWLDGRSLEQAMAAGASVLDRFPDAVIVSSETSSQALAAAGFRVESPVDLPAGRTVTLLRSRDVAGHAAGLDEAAFEAQGARLIWRGGRDAIAVSPGPLLEAEALLGQQRKLLRSSPLRPRPQVAAVSKAATSDFAPAIQEMVDQVSGAALMQWIGNLAGTRAVTVGGNPVTFTTRSTPTAQCDLAEQYVFEQFQAMGFTDVQYDPYTFSTTSARNIVATLPGTETPQYVYILGGHLDSTSPQASTLAPGANDNASGAAGLLLAAQILRQYSFRSTIRFVVFTGEEQGLYGSEHYAQAAAARGDSILGVVIYDMIAWHDALYQIDIEGETAWLPVMNVMNDACARYTGLATQIQLSSWGSDHVPFQEEGFPAFLAIESEYDAYPCYHKTCDTTGLNQADFGAEVTRAGVATVAHLAGVHDFYISHTPLPSTENVTGPYEVVADIPRLAPLVADSLELHWSAGGPYVSTPLLATGVADRYHAFIPGQPATSRVTYWLSAVDTTGRHAWHPAGAPGAVNEFWVGERTTLYSEGFEAGAPGWTHGGTSDDWQVGAPVGLGGDPAAAYAGTMVAGTDLSGLGASPGKYENGCDTWFESPAVNCSTMTGVRLSFARWLGVERSNGGSWDYARVFVNGAKVWESPSDANLIDTAWQPQELDISALADGDPAVRLRFTLHSDGSVNYGGWNLDDVELRGMSTIVTTDVASGAPPAAAVLYASVPNPGPPGATLRFDLPVRGLVDLSIFDVRGRRVRTLLHGVREAGRHAVAWDGRADAGTPGPPGVYFYRLTTDRASLSRKLILIR
jgi:hypothetical protein